MYFNKKFVTFVPNYKYYNDNKIFERENIEHASPKLVFLELVKHIPLRHPEFIDVYEYNSLALEAAGYKTLGELVFKNCEVNILEFVYPSILFNVKLYADIKDQKIKEKIEELFAIIEKNI